MSREIGKSTIMLETAHLIGNERSKILMFHKEKEGWKGREELFGEELQDSINRMILLEKQRPRITSGQWRVIDALGVVMTEEPTMSEEIVRNLTPGSRR